jgi:rare lipoprotein A
MRPYRGNSPQHGAGVLAIGKGAAFALVLGLILGAGGVARADDVAAPAMGANAVGAQAEPLPMPKKPALRKAAKRGGRVARAAASRKSGPSPKPRPPFRQVGIASWYNGHGRRTASGQRHNDNAFTAAHLTLPMHSRARVTNLENGKSVTVRVTDRGPHKRGRIIDLSRSAAEELDMKESGLARVEVELLPPRSPPPRRSIAQVPQLDD